MPFPANPVAPCRCADKMGLHLSLWYKDPKMNNGPSQVKAEHVFFSTPRRVPHNLTRCQLSLKFSCIA